VQFIAERFEIGEFIAQGGMGAVYRGLDRQTGQTVAIKSIRPELVDTALIARFQQEGETLRTLNHPNIVKLVATVQEGDQHYLIMEYVGGGSLADLLAKQVKLSADQTISIALELADALARAHHLKVIHRDLKPANMLLAEDGTPRLTDFGVARTAQGNLTGTGVIVGTLSYLAPEILNGESADRRADIWAFGVTLFEMLTGRLPFRADAPVVLITAILTQPTPDLEAIRPDLPVALVDLVYRMLDKDPRQRIGSMRQIAAELETIVNAERIENPSTRQNTKPIRDETTVVREEKTVREVPSPTPSRTHHNLPVQTTPFVGREPELNELAKLMADPRTRLISILGSGGMGKTRLALEIAEAHKVNYTDGTYFISLAPISDPDLVVTTVAEIIGFTFYGGETPPKQQLLNYCREKSLLLVFDNFEHVLEVATLVNEILQVAPGVKILVTSRERLNIDGETLFRVEGMNFPDWQTPEEAAEYSAAKLFVQSAKRIQPAFALTADNVKYLAQICRQVEGLPLGILLAAAWIDQLSLPEIVSEIGHSLDFLETERRDVPTRQRSIRAVFDYSWNLLTTDEQAIFAQLAVFRGGFARDSAQVVTGATLRTLASLTNKSLIRRDANGRYDMHELLRHYAEFKLSESQPLHDVVAQRHGTYFSNLVEQQRPQIFSARQLSAIKVVEIDLDNIYKAWSYVVSQKDFAALHLFIEGLLVFNLLRSHLREAEKLWSETINALRLLPKSPAEKLIYSTLLSSYSLLVGIIYQSETAKAICTENERLLTEFPPDVREAGLVEMSRGIVFGFIGDSLGEPLADLLRRQQQAIAIFQRTGDVFYLGVCEFAMSRIYEASNDLGLALEMALRSQQTLERLSGRGFENMPALALGTIYMRQGQLLLAKAQFERMLERARATGGIEPSGYALINIGRILWMLGEQASARQHVEQALEIFRNSGFPEQQLALALLENMKTASD
jgi:non-specific serine/threonine protein kinase